MTTILQKLKNIAKDTKRLDSNSDNSDSFDSTGNENFIRNTLVLLGFHKAKVVYGIVYLEGYGNPISIQEVAKALLRIIENKQLENFLDYLPYTKT